MANATGNQLPMEFILVVSISSPQRTLSAKASGVHFLTDALFSLKHLHEATN